jgi:hypothetical protein
MYHLREREGIMASRAEEPWTGEPPSTEFFNGLWVERSPTIFAEPS